MRAVPGIASDLFYLGAGGRERSMLVSEEEGTCVWLALDFGCRVSLCGAGLGQLGVRGVLGSTRQEGFYWGDRSVPWGSGLKSHVDPGHHCHFIQPPMTVRSALQS